MAETVHSTPEDRRVSYEAFDRLGFPNVSELLFVCHGFKEELESCPNYAFLIEENATSYVVLELRLELVTYTKINPDSPSDEWVMKEANPVEVARRWVSLPRRMSSFDDPGEEFWRSGKSSLVLQIDWFVMARVVEHHGDCESAASLFDVALEMAGEWEKTPVPPAELGLWIVHELGDGMVRKSLRSFSEGETNRDQLAERLEDLYARFPGHRSRDWARRTAVHLRHDQNEMRRTIVDSASRLSSKQSIADLIECLVESSYVDWEFEECRSEENLRHPARLLARKGYEAVPALIAAFDDRRLTRRATICFPFRISTIGDRAVEIIEQIACQRFLNIREKLLFSEHPDKAAIAQRIRDWFAGANVKGEQTVLLEGLALPETSPGADKKWYARRLVDRFPDIALFPVAEQLPTLTSDIDRRVFMELINDIPGEAATAVLANELKRENRGTAISILRHRDDPGAIYRVIAEWHPDEKLEGDQLEDRLRLGEMLALCGKVPAMKAIARGIKQVTPREREAIVERIGWHFRDDTDRYSSDSKSESERRELRSLLFTLFVSLLADTEELPQGTNRYPRRSWPDHRMCDLAGNALHEIAPDRFPYDVQASRKQRDEWRLSFTNRWRAEQGLEPLDKL